jgi:hypothetical protein
MFLLTDTIAERCTLVKYGVTLYTTPVKNIFSFSMDEQHRGGVSIGSVLLLVLFFLVVASAGSAVYFYRQLSLLKANPEKIAQEELQSIVSRVGKLIALPEGEDPTIATVSDPTLLQSQPFFAKAKAGDKVLLYANAKKAILYDVAANKILEVAPIVIGNPESQQSDESVLAAPPAAEQATTTVATTTLPQTE